VLHVPHVTHRQTELVQTMTSQLRTIVETLDAIASAQCEPNEPQGSTECFVKTMCAENVACLKQHSMNVIF